MTTEDSKPGKKSKPQKAPDEPTSSASRVEEEAPEEQAPAAEAAAERSTVPGIVPEEVAIQAETTENLLRSLKLLDEANAQGMIKRSRYEERTALLRGELARRGALPAPSSAPVAPPAPPPAPVRVHSTPPAPSAPPAPAARTVRIAAPTPPVAPPASAQREPPVIPTAKGPRQATKVIPAAVPRQGHQRPARVIGAAGAARPTTGPTVVSRQRAKPQPATPQPPSQTRGRGGGRIIGEKGQRRQGSTRIIRSK